MRVELTIPTDKVYVERLFQCLDHVGDNPSTARDRRFRAFIIEEFRRIRAKYNGNPRIDMEAVIEAEDTNPLEKPLYQNTKLDKLRVGRLDQSLETHIDKVARIIRNRKNYEA